jgi:hypothetical protein
MPRCGEPEGCFCGPEAPRPRWKSFLLGVAVALVGGVAAAEQDPAKSVRVDLMPVSLGESLATWYVNHGEVVKLEAFESAMGTPVFYRGPQTLALYAKPEDARPRKEGEAVVSPLATVTLPSGNRRVLLLFAPGKDNKPQLRAYGVDDAALKGGDYRVYNFAPVAISGRMGERAIQLKPGQTSDISSPAWRDAGADLEVEMGFNRGGKQQVVYSTIWSHFPERRNYIFVVPTGNPTNPLELRKFHDVPAVKSLGFVAGEEERR